MARRKIEAWDTATDFSCDEGLVPLREAMPNIQLVRDASGERSEPDRQLLWGFQRIIRRYYSDL